jgi:hypothetical protein
VKPPEYRNNQACDQRDHIEAHCHPVTDRHFVSLKNPGFTVQNIFTLELGFSFDKAIPESAAAIDAKIDRDDASDNFIKEELHANIRSSGAARMTRQ